MQKFLYTESDFYGIYIHVIFQFCYNFAEYNEMDYMVCKSYQFNANVDTEYVLFFFFGLRLLTFVQLFHY